MARIEIDVPATSANMGPGFDCLGVALSAYNRIVIEENDSGEINVVWAADNDIVLPLEENLVYTSFLTALDAIGFRHSGVTIHIPKPGIPIARGLGSSAASVVAGVLAANEIAGRPLCFEKVLALAVEIEGHPDNVVPAMVGGMTVAVLDGRESIYSKVAVPSSLRFVALVSNFNLGTAQARAILPHTYSKEDVVFNLSRVSLLVSCMQNADLGSFRKAFADRVHQPYRIKLIPGAGEILSKLQKAGSLAEYISGAGPTIMALAENDAQARQLAEKVSRDLGDAQKGIWTPVILRPELGGASVKYLTD